MSSPWRLREKEREHWKKKLPRNSHRRVACRPRRPGRKRPRCLPGRLAGRSRVRGRRVGPRRAAPGRLVSAARRRPSAIDRTAAGERQHGRDRAGPGLVLLVRLVLAVSVGCSPAAAGEQGQQEQQEHEGERRRRRSSASPPVEREHGCSLCLFITSLLSRGGSCSASPRSRRLEWWFPCCALLSETSRARHGLKEKEGESLLSFLWMGCSN